MSPRLARLSRVAVGRAWPSAISRVAVGLVRPSALVLLCVLAALHPAEASGPSTSAIASWTAYVRAIDAVRAEDLSRGVRAWATDEDASGTGVLRTITTGEVHTIRRDLPGIRVEDATIEHWQGSVLVRGVSLEQVMERLRYPDRYPQPPDVRAMTVTNRGPEGHDLYLRLTRSMLVTATYDTWHRVRLVSRGAARLDSVSVASRIDEVDAPGTSSERHQSADAGRGFLWRMQTWWRFTPALPGGVIVTCESVTLSRPVPTGLGLIARPIITRVARESMVTALQAWQRGWR